MSTAQVILLVGQWAVGTWLLGRIASPRDLSHAPGQAEAWPAVSVIIPARDEEASLPHLLASIGHQTHPAREVIVIDDHSGDATAALATAWGATVRSAPDLAPGWLGKPAACAAGAAVATGEVLVFLDADVTLAPHALGALVDERRRRGGLVSVQPHHRTVRAYERLSAICNLVAMMGTLAFTGPPRPKVTMAFGPCLIASRADYNAAGGHGHPSVRAVVVEDMALARTFRAVDLPVTVLGGRRVVSFRMYPSGLRQLIDGWTRSLVAGARGTSPLALLGPFFWVWGALVAAADGVRALGGGRHWALDAVVYGAWAAQIAWMLRRVGRFGVFSALLFPVPLVAFVAIFARSLVLAATGRQVRWRGRLVGGR